MKRNPELVAPLTFLRMNVFYDHPMLCDIRLSGVSRERGGSQGKDDYLLNYDSTASTVFKDKIRHDTFKAAEGFRVLAPRVDCE